MKTTNAALLTAIITLTAIIIAMFILNAVENSGYGSCGRCRLTWNRVEPHTTMYSEDRGCFPLCESCWSSLSPDERLPYYRELVWIKWSRWKDQSCEEWETIKTAVLGGK